MKENVLGKEGKWREKGCEAWGWKLGLGWWVEKSDQMDDSSILPDQPLNQKKEAQVL